MKEKRILSWLPLNLPIVVSVLVGIAKSQKPDDKLLLPFLESDGSISVPFGVDDFAEIQLERNFSFLGTSYSSAFISGNGMITFGQGPGPFLRFECQKTLAEFPTISVYSAGADGKREEADPGKLLYRQDTSRASLHKVTRDVVKAFPDFKDNHTLNWMLIVTWYRILPDGYSEDRNTFQAVLTTDGTVSVVLFYYKNITWPGEFRAEVGFNGGKDNREQFYLVPHSCTPAILDISSTSNFGSPGKFVFKVDREVEHPLTGSEPASIGVELLPYLEGLSTDLYYITGDYTRMTLTRSFNFLGTRYSTAFANEDGIITFQKGSKSSEYDCDKTAADLPTISVFMADAFDNGDGSEIAKLFYREDTSRTSLDKVSEDVFKAFPTLKGNVTLNWMLIVTWSKIRALSRLGSAYYKNTYQAVLTTDGLYSFVLFYYKDINWPFKGLDINVEAGIYGGKENTEHTYLVPDSCSEALGNITSMSNIGTPGKFVFRVDSLELPNSFPKAPTPPSDFVGNKEPVVENEEPEGTSSYDHVGSWNLLPYLNVPGTKRFRFGDNEHTSISLEQPFRFLGTEYSTVYINGNGVLTFESGSGRRALWCKTERVGVPMITPYLADADNDRGDGPTSAKLLYRQDTSRSVLDKVTRDVVTVFPQMDGKLALNWTLVVTWSNIPPAKWQGSEDQRNTFQTVLTTDGTHSFVLFYYGNMTWPSNSWTSGTVGIFGGVKNFENSFIVPGSCSPSILDITRRSKLAFQVENHLELPESLRKTFESDLELLPYLESDGSHILPFQNNEYTSISLKRDFSFLRKTYPTAFINGDGMITFGNGSGASHHNCNKRSATLPTISVYMARAFSRILSVKHQSKLLYRQDISRSSLDKISKDVFAAYPELKENVTLDWMLIVTWEEIASPAYYQEYLRNTFQAVLTTDGTHSFVLFYYKKITWPMEGMESRFRAEAGIYGGPGNTKSFYLIPGSCTLGLGNVTRTSNIGVPGKFVFKVDRTVELPVEAPDASTPTDNGSSEFGVGAGVDSSGSERLFFISTTYESVDLERHFNFLGTNYITSFISERGLVFFGDEIYDFYFGCDVTRAKAPAIAAYLAEADSNREDGGTAARILYRQDTNGSSLSKVSKDVTAAFPVLADHLNLTWMMLVTWENLPPKEGSAVLRNSFQAVLITDGVKSFVLLYYKNITWAGEFRAEVGSQPVNETLSEAGIYGGRSNLQDAYLLPNSCTPSIVNIASTSNIGVPGKFVFRVDNRLVLPSLSPCVPIIPVSPEVLFLADKVPALGSVSLVSHNLNLCPSSNVTSVTCVFHDSGRQIPVELEGHMLESQLAAVCPTPEFYSLGRTRVDMTLNFSSGQVISTHGHVIVVKPQFNEHIKFEMTREGDQNKNHIQYVGM